MSDIGVRVRAFMDERAARDGRLSSAGWRPGEDIGGVPVPESGHGEAGGVKWRITDADGRLTEEWEGGLLCWCGEIFARSAADGGMPAASASLAEHEDGQVT